MEQKYCATWIESVCWPGFGSQDPLFRCWSVSFSWTIARASGLFHPLELPHRTKMFSIPFPDWWTCELLSVLHSRLVLQWMSAHVQQFLLRRCGEPWPLNHRVCTLYMITDAAKLPPKWLYQLLLPPTVCASLHFPPSCQCLIPQVFLESGSCAKH